MVGLVADHGVHPELQGLVRIIGAEGIQAIPDEVLHGTFRQLFLRKGERMGQVQESRRIIQVCVVLQQFHDPLRLTLYEQAGEQEAGLVQCRFGGKDFLQHALGASLIAGLQQLFDLGQSLLSHRGKMLLDPLTKLRLRQGAGQFGHHLTVHEELQVGNAAHLIAGGDVGVGLGVHLDQFPAPVRLAGELFNDGTEEAAGTTPCGPKIHQYRNMRTTCDHLPLKVGHLEVNPRLGRHHASSGSSSPEGPYPPPGTPARRRKRCCATRCW